MKKKESKKTNLNAVRENKQKKMTNSTPKTTAPKKTVAPKVTTKKTVPKKAEEYMLRKSGLDKEGNQQLTAIRVYKRKPNGWKEDKGATTAPKGYAWISNGKSLFSGERRTGLIKADK